MKIVKWLDEHLEEALLIALLIIITCSSGIQVIMRYVFNNSLVWSEEISKYAFIWSGFFSIGYCIRKGLSIKIDALVQFLPQALQKLFFGIGMAALLALFVLLTRASLLIVGQAIASGQTSPALHIPMGYIYSGPLIGFVIAIVRIVELFVKWMLGRTPELHTKEEV